MKKSMAIIGGNGGLGQAIISAIKSRWWKTLSLDFTESKIATKSIILDKAIPIPDQLDRIHKEILAFDTEYDAMISVAGTVNDDTEISSKSFFGGYEKAYKKNMESALLRIVSELTRI